MLLIELTNRKKKTITLHSTLNLYQATYKPILIKIHVTVIDNEKDQKQLT